MPNTVEIYDDLNLYSWEFVLMHFDYGPYGYGMIYRERVMDDQTIIEEHFQGGIITEMVQIDAPDGGTQPWEYIQTQFDYMGRIEFKMFIFDDGRRIEHQYQDGMLYTKFQMDEGTDGDPDGAYDWYVSYTEYDPFTGHALMHFVEYDNGEIQETWYRHDGTIQTIEHRDSQDYYGGEYMGAHAWNTTYTAFDDFGQITDRYIEYDDTGFTHDRYQNGVIESSESRDGSANAYAWDMRDAYYDENGDLLHMFYRFDDGSERSENYQDGVITDSYAYNWNFDPEYGAPWQSVTMHYDEFGALLHREVENHDGTRKTDFYEDGILMRSDSYDHFHGPDGQAWEQQTFLFTPNGELDAKGIAWDTGDLEVTFYAPDGSSEHRYFDGDDSNDWQARTVQYDDAGTVVWTEEYADEDPLPPDYIPYELFNGGGVSV